MGRLATVVKSLFKVRGSAPGKAVVVQIAAGSVERTAELYHPPGVSSMPTPEDRVIEVEIYGGKRVLVASHNYRVEVEPAAGETLIYSTNAAGDTVGAKIHLKADGTIEMNGGDKSLVTWTELNTALQTMLATLNTALAAKLDGGGTVGTATLDISAAKTTTVLTGG